MINNKELLELLSKINEWRKSKPVESAFTLQYTHGYPVSEEFSNNIQKVWDRVEEILND